MPQTAPGHRTAARSSGYMPALDGLRAFAVLAVVLYHLGVPSTQGGLIGVTVFFVISGYLITKLLLKEYARTGTLDFKSFYIKRVKRLMPAIVLVVLVTATLCTLFNHALLTKMRPDVLPSLFFFNNWWQIANDASYFDNIGGPSPLTHFWSLAIEEQFYLVLPVCLFLALRFGASRRQLAGGVLVLALASIVAMAVLYDPAADPTRVYYGTDTRAFSLLIGVALAVVSANRRDRRLTPAVCDGLALLGIGGLVLFVVLCEGTGPFLYYGGFLLASILSAAAIVGLVESGGGLVARVFSLKPLLWVGTRSYGIYLWHYPLALLMTPQNAASDLPWWHPVVLAVVIGLVAEASYRLVEQPIRTGTFRFWRAPRPVARRRPNGPQRPEGSRQPATSRERSSSGRSQRPTLPAPLATLGRLQPVVLAVGACALVALCSFAFVPDTSVLSKEGAALLSGSDEAVTSGSGPAAKTEANESAPTAEAEAPSSAAEAEGGDNTYLATDSRTDSQRAFDEALVNKPVPEGAYNVVWIGDSVSIRPVPYAQKAFPSGYIDAKKNRRLAQGVEIYQSLAASGQVGNVVVFALGTNGAPKAENIDAAVQAVGPDTGIWFVTLRTSEFDPTASNQAMRDAASRYENVRVIDWHAASEGHDEYFDGDGTHLSELGAQVYTSLIADGVAVQLPEGAMDFQSAEDNEATMYESWTTPSDGESA